MQVSVSTAHSREFIRIYEYIFIYVTGMKFGLKRWRGSDVAIVTGVPVMMPTDAQMNYGIFCAHAQWFSHQKTKADSCDIIK